MTLRGAPIWLAAPTRLAGLSRRTARWILAALLLLSLIAILAPPGEAALDDPLSLGVIASMRQGGTFYDSLAVLLRGDAVARSFAATPQTMALIAGTLPGWALLALIAATLAALLWAGSTRLTAVFPSLAACTIAIALLAGGCAAGALLWLVAPPAGWAAMLLALALFVDRPGHTLQSIALACIAAMIAPAAIILVIVLAGLTWADTGRRAAMPWLAAAVIASVVLAAHWHALAALALPPLPEVTSPAVTPDTTSARLVTAAFPSLPPGWAAPLLPFALLGWVALATPMAGRIVALIAAATLIDAATPLRTVPLVSVLVAPGLAFAPDALADLIRAAFDRRRFTVTRMTR